MRDSVGPSGVQEEVKEGDGSDLSSHGRFPATVGPVGKWCIRRMVKVGRPLREEESCQQAVLTPSLLHDDDGRRRRCPRAHQQAQDVGGTARSGGGPSLRGRSGDHASRQPERLVSVLDHSFGVALRHS